MMKQLIQDLADSQMNETCFKVALIELLKFDWLALLNLPLRIEYLRRNFEE